jgi:hypothetical protein
MSANETGGNEMFRAQQQEYDETRWEIVDQHGSVVAQGFNSYKDAAAEIPGCEMNRKFVVKEVGSAGRVINSTHHEKLDDAIYEAARVSGRSVHDVIEAIEANYTELPVSVPSIRGAINGSAVVTYADLH